MRITYIFIYNVTFSYLLAFHLYMESVHKNHSLRVLGARIQIAPLFYSFFHPKYQQLHLRDLFQHMQMPKELREYQERNESFTVSQVRLIVDKEQILFTKKLIN